MVDNSTVMVDGICVECSCKENDGYSCFEQFGFPLVWEHNDENLYAQHFWLVTCYMIQHPSNYTDEGYEQMVQLFIDAYDNKWETSYILKTNRERIKSVDKITSPIVSESRKRILFDWSMTIQDVYLNGEENAIVTINQWKEAIRKDLNRFKATFPVLK